MPNTQFRFCCYVDKGGVTKTTSVGHIGRALAGDHDLDVLLIDAAGRQNDLATLFGLADEVSGELDAPLSAVFRDDWDFIRQNIDDVVDMMIFETDHPNVNLIPADPGLEGADNDLANIPVDERFNKLDQFISEDLNHYDVVVLDLPGKESNIALNGLVATKNVVAPVKPGEFERRQLDQLPDVLASIVDDYPTDLSLELVMVLPCAVDSQKNMHQEFLEYVEKSYPYLVADAYVCNSVDVEEAPKREATVFDQPDDQLYSTGKRAREAYRDVTDDLLTRLKA